jgi:AraC family transcriptional regulator of adaptative response / DNA-3-methyladenine glycosylase II
MDLDRAACYRALQARDERFDGRMFTAVRTTGIYCRPICPARTPKLENIEFFATAAAAQGAGFRPCLRCRPESSPELAAWRGTSETVARGLALIASGILDDDETGVGTIAARLGVGERQLRRLFRRHLGVSPIAVAQTRRVLFAKQLIHETQMGMTDVALAAGFGSVRRFNATFRRLFGRPPSALRRGARHGIDGPPAWRRSSGISLRLAYAGPYDWPAIVDFLAYRAIPGIESVDDDAYRRTIEIGGSHGTVEVRPSGAAALEATIVFPDVRALPAIVSRIRRVFDLAADVETINADLAGDPDLGLLVTTRPGLRVPGAWDGFELAVRAVLGQQITVAGARQLAGRLVERYGEPLRAEGAPAGLASVFPAPARLAAADLAPLGMPGSRARALSNLAAAVVAEPDLFEPRHGLDQAVARLRAISGVGEWTAQYIAMRAIREPDAFPAADIGLLRAMTPPGGQRLTPAELLARADAWRPWRAYAAQHLWTTLGAGAGSHGAGRAEAGAADLRKEVA